jgi:hypothetical protein
MNLECTPEQAHAIEALGYAEAALRHVISSAFWVLALVESAIGLLHLSP